MGHDGYLIVDDKLFYRAPTVGGESDMDNVTGRITSVLYHLALIADGMETHPFYRTTHSGGHGPQVFGSEDLHAMTEWCAKEEGLEQITKENLPQKPSLYLTIDNKTNHITLNRYTAQFLPKNINLAKILRTGYSFIVK